MDDKNDDLEGLLSQLRFKAPPMEAVWRPERRRRWLGRPAAIALALAATLCLAGGVLAANSGLLN